MQYEPDPRDDMDSYGEICYEVGLDLEPNKYAKLRKAAMLAQVGTALNSGQNWSKRQQALNSLC